MKISKEIILRALSSFFLAFFLWIVATANTNPIKTVRFSNIPVHYVNTGEDLVVDNPVSGVTIRIQGATNYVTKIQKGDIRAVVDMSSITKAGDYTLEVVIEGLPDTVSISDISEKYVLVKVGNIVTTSSGFELETTGTLSAGAINLGLSYDDVDVSVIGSDNITDGIAVIKGVLDMSGRSSSFEAEVPLYAYDAAGKRIESVTISPETVNVYVSVGMAKTVPVNVVTTGEPAEGYSVEGITLSAAGIMIAGESDVLMGIEKIDSLPVDTEGVSSSFDAVLGFDLPSGVILYSTDDIVAHFTVNTVSTKTIVYSNIQIRNAADLTGIINDDVNVAVTVMAGADILPDLTEDDVVAFIDLQGLEPGEHEVTIQYDIPDGVTIIETTQSTVNVTVRGE